jgi:diguanylate cyclase (GGDEF)-like protein/PAS domain S-box-containing protein
MDALSELLGSSNFMPHGHCYYWKPEILWSLVTSNLLIALAYYSIPLALIYFVRHRKDLQFNWIFVMFSAFIFACGTTHLIDIWTIWTPVYWLDIWARFTTAAVSILTAIMLWRLMPQALSLPSMQDLRDSVEQLQNEVRERKATEHALQMLKESLEIRVQERTAELLKINRQLEQEIERRRKVEQALIAEKQRAMVTLESIGDGVITTDTKAKVSYLNPIAERMTGWSNAEAQGKPLIEVFRIVNESTRKMVPNPVEMVIAHGETHGLANHTLLLGKHGEEYAIEDSAAPIKGADGEVFGVVMVFHDVSEARKMATRMTYLAEHDFLTGLPNRLLINDRLQQALTYAKRDQGYVALMFLDLDRFKNINDTLGHETGDKLLKQVAERLQNCLRSSDTISRQGGDEFMILLPEISDHFAPAEVADKLLTISDEPFIIDAHELRVTISIGIAVFPDDGDSVETLTKCADAAMYHAKSLGRNNYQFFTQAMNERVKQLTELEAHLRKAIRLNEFKLHYQPKFDIQAGYIVGAEALIRWEHPEWGLVSPDRFITIAEETGLIREIGFWVLQAACRQYRSWKDAGIGPLKICVNVSAVQLRQKSFLQQLTEILMSTGMDPEYLELEVTESVAIESEEEVITLLKSLRKMGVGLAIDDFGTGFSSLSYLKRLPVDTIKIDRSFVRDIQTDPDDATIITAIIRMSQGLKLNVVAEGVENETQLAFLREEGCNQYQGYLISEPLDADAFAQFVDKNGNAK